MIDGPRVHFDAGSGWPLCGAGGNQFQTTSTHWNVTCARCVPLLPPPPPTYPVYPSADYCSTCGLSFTHWLGCGHAS